MHLIDPKMMMQQGTTPVTAPVNPIHRSIVTLDDDMKTVLDRRDLTDQEKVRQYNQILQRYLEYQDHLRTPSLSKVSQNVKEDEEEIIRTVPPKYQRKAQHILKRIQHASNMNWNERGEYIHNGEVIRGSNIVDLVNDVVRHRKAFHPHGWQEFALALRQGSVPQDLIGNHKRWDWMHRESATSDAFSTAEESSPKRRLSRPRYRTPAQRRSVSKKMIKRESTSLKKEIKWEYLS